MHRYELEYTLVLGRLPAEQLYARVRGTTLYVHTDQATAPCGYVRIDDQARRTQRTINDYLNEE